MTELLLHGNSLEELRKLSDNSVDSCVTDPPYGLSKEPNINEVLSKWLAGEDYEHIGGGFMDKTWDSFVPGPSIWREVFRVLKPGGHALVFSGTRTQDLMTTALRLSGFEVRDVIEWLYFSGFPKSMDVSKAFDKKAGAEREVIGEGKSGKTRSILNAANYPDSFGGNYDITAPATELAHKWEGWGTALKPAHEPIIVVRKPLISTVCDNIEEYSTGAINIDGCRIPGEVKERGGTREKVRGYVGIKSSETVPANPPSKLGRFPANCVTTEEGEFYSTFFNITPSDLSKKASKSDRNEDYAGQQIYGGNVHPTVKPTALMSWLVRLVTPPGGTTLDPFAGSGTTLVAAKRDGFGFIGIELQLEYIEIIKARIGA